MASLQSKSQLTEDTTLIKDEQYAFTWIDPKIMHLTKFSLHSWLKYKQTSKQSFWQVRMMEGGIAVIGDNPLWGGKLASKTKKQIVMSVCATFVLRWYKWARKRNWRSHKNGRIKTVLFHGWFNVNLFIFWNIFLKSTGTNKRFLQGYRIRE